MKAALALAGSLFALTAGSALAQGSGPPPKEPLKGTPLVPARLPDGHPNWTGFWAPPGGFLETDFGPSGISNRSNQGGQLNVQQVQPPNTNLKSPYKEKFDEIRDQQAKGLLPDYSALCTPNGMPNMMGMIYGMEFLQTPNIYAITSEYQGTTRRILMKEKNHPPPDEIEETYAGHSIGHWEKDVLVVDTVGTRADVPIGPGRMPHSPKVHIVERFHALSPGILVDDVVIEDEDALITPLKQTRTYRYHPETNLHEYICQENNRLVDPVTGKPTWQAPPAK